MHRLLSRTSITIDEAVYILIGQSAGPIDIELMGDKEEEDEDGYVFCLRDILEDELDVLSGEYDMAKYEKRPADVIAEKLAALQHQEAVIEQANLHRCAIEDELNKGEQSALRMDRVLSNAIYRFITLHSFNEWVKSSAGPSTESVPVSVKVQRKKEPRTRLIQQEGAVLAEIRKQGFDPMALPPNRPGHAGVKAAIRKSLKDSALFEGTTTFDKTWERLAKLRRIVHEV